MTSLSVPHDQDCLGALLWLWGLFFFFLSRMACILSMKSGRVSLGFHFKRSVERPHQVLRTGESNGPRLRVHVDTEGSQQGVEPVTFL